MSLAEYIDVETTKDELIRVCKQAANLIRTRVDYKYILVLLFLKKLSDKWKKEYNEALKQLGKEGLIKGKLKSLQKMLPSTASCTLKNTHGTSLGKTSASFRLGLRGST